MIKLRNGKLLKEARPKLEIPQSKCILCNDEVGTLIPRQCWAPISHKMCEECWFHKFAPEHLCHYCPACKVPRPKPVVYADGMGNTSSNAVVIDDD